MSKHVKINVNENGTGKVVVVADDGTETDISGAVNAFEVHRGTNARVTALLSLPWASGEFLATAAHVPISTAMALQALGWTPPPGQPTLHDTAAPASTEPGCQHPDCVLDHPHAGPAELARREHP